MTVTEAGAGGTPAVATRIGGHEDAVLDGRSGLLVDSTRRTRDRARRRPAGTRCCVGASASGALDHAARLTWDTTARGTLAALGAEALARTD